MALRTTLAVGFALVLLSSADRAFAQACCAGAAAITPARLALHEDALVGATIRAGSQVGVFDPFGHWVATPSGNREHDFEEDLLGAISVFERGQLALQVPILETYRKLPGVSEIGGGIGDINVAARWDFWYSGETQWLPGFAVLTGVTLPTGRAGDQAKNTLSTDATGVGAVQISAGIGLEKIFAEHYLVDLTAIGSQRLPRSTMGVSETLGFLFAGNLAAGYAFDGAVLALVGHMEYERHAIENGAVEANTRRMQTTIGVAGGYSIDDQWRVQGALAAPIPISNFSMNQPASIGFTFTLIRAWI